MQLTNEGVELGSIEQVSRGLCTDVLTDTNTFRIDAPVHFDTSAKALLIGATILLVIL
jgi:hypothetical protein